MTPAAIQRYISNPRYAYFAGWLDNQLAGVIAIRNHQHLFHLFVAPPLQGQGIARQLWQFAKTDAIVAGNQDGFTVNSTPYAVPIYERFGFTITGEKVEMNGIAFIPMQLNL
ncbi:MAG: GNAT family N-acetyltransferase [Kamptonema sp. SIO4C4]|nr:GNAT family N-acetyltransferase [Kamptonema sp. SIO4C4]